MVDTFQPRSLSCFRIRERRHDNEMNLEKENVPRDSQHDMGWKAQRTFSLLPVAGEIVLLTFSFIERGNRTRVRLRDLSGVEWIADFNSALRGVR